MNVNVKPNEANDEWLSKLRELGDRAEGVAKMGAYDGAKVIADGIKAATPVGETGDLQSSLGISKIEAGGDRVTVSVSFTGYDSKGVPNILKARVFESGTPKRAPRPFVKGAVSKNKAAAVEAIKGTIEGEIEKIASS